MPDDTTALDFLWRSVPGWFAFPSRQPSDIRGFVSLEHTVWQRGTLSLSITARGGAAVVKETEVSRLPEWCPELHLNADRTFCLGLDELAIVDDAHARQWWADLEVHLKLLSAAIKTRVWPLHSGLAHGDAGKYQREARLLAEGLGLGEEYARVLGGDGGWLADLDMARVSGNGVRKPSGLPCPCGCRRKSGKSFSWTQCPRRRKVDRLILLERARRLALADFWEACRILGKTCCGRIRDCPLAENAKPE